MKSSPTTLTTTSKGLMARMLALDDFERAARRKLPRSVFGFISGGAETSASMNWNREAFQDHAFVARVLRNVSMRSLERELMGRRYKAPFGISPMGAIGVAAYRGDLAMAEAAHCAGIPFLLSGASLIRMEEVHEAAPSAWFQAYLPGEAERIKPLVDRVRRAGFETLVLTVDIPVFANRENNVRNGWSLPLKPSPRLAHDGLTHPSWLIGTVAKTLLKHGMPHFENMDAERGPPILSANLQRDVGKRAALAWEHVKLMRERWRGRLVLKGLLAAEDAKLAKAAGMDGVIVSNHGGRQLDGSLASLRALPAIVAESSGMAVMLDGGVRRGSDVLKAICLGADFVFLGRPFLYAVAVGGEAGVAHAATLLSEEISRDMAMLGVTSLDELGPSCLTPVPGRR